MNIFQMGKFLAILFCILISNLTVSYGQSCNNYAFRSNAIYATCVTLPVLNAHLHWNYSTNGTVDVAFRHTGSTTSQWVSWALNIGGSGMLGAQALVAIPNSNGSVEAYTSAVTSYGTSLQRSSLSFVVPAIRAERVNGDVVIYATLVLPRGTTSFNQVWQVGPVTNGVPSIHALNPDNRNSVGRVDFTTGQTTAGGNVGGPRQHRKNEAWKRHLDAVPVPEPFRKRETAGNARKRHGNVSTNEETFHLVWKRNRLNGKRSRNVSGPNFAFLGLHHTLKLQRIKENPNRLITSL